ncbi:sushi, von Willebrand factor type A, EGF and pentraxin domain-containing protein 1-like isoform X8 [Apostichopus japonicus]|uniref:sushi, von Willebrand factor type A, EGF and pentraxin domain-containing protein 1-like isoform X8 n=1 Tax=Stichopus japonicus TaxID=307972 RepID=UPI003AB3A6A4
MERMDWRISHLKETYLLLLLVITLTTSCIQAQSCNSGQCYYDESQVDDHLNCVISPFGASNDTCFSTWSSVSSCACDSNYRISSSGASYWCYDDDNWDSGLYNLVCYAPCYTDAGPNVISMNSVGEETNVIEDSDYVLYSCPDGFSASGTSSVTCTDGAWGPHQVFLCSGPCNLPTNYEFVDTMVTEPVNDGVTVSLRCIDGYEPTDVTIVECQNGTFGDVPTCVLATPCTPPTPDDNNVVISPNYNSYDNGTTVTYSCPGGYDIAGNLNSQCINGSWSPPDYPTCETSICLPQTVSDDLVIISPDLSGYSNGSSITYSCPDRYILEGSNTSVCINTVWTQEEDPTCTKILECLNPVPLDPVIILDPDLELYLNGSDVQFSCPIGYQLNGNESASCVNGDWVYVDEPSCSVLECANPAPIDPMVNLNPDRESYTNGTEVQYSCPNGFELNGDSSAVCVNGDWVFTEAPSCSALSCDDVAPGDDVVERDPSGSGSFPNGTKVVYSCPDGYDLSGDTTALCLYGNWTLDTDPSCTALSCDEEAPAGEMVVRNPSGSAPYQNGTEVVYSCPDGYALEGDMTAVCLYGNWTLDTEPSCGVLECANPAPMDPMVNLKPDLESYTNGTEVQYSCPNGFALNGDSSAFCVNGEWVFTEEPSCSVLSCDDVAPGDDVVERDPSGSGPFPNGTKVVYSCPDGYDLSGDTTALCLYGNWTLDTDPSCTALSCDEEAPAGEMVVRNPSGSAPYQNGTEVVYSCPDGYALEGDMTAVCLYGNWTLDTEPSCGVLECANPAPMDPMVNLKPDLESYTNGTEVQYSCPNGFALNGDSSAFCVNGDWVFTEAPSCSVLSCDDVAPGDDMVERDPSGSGPFPNGTKVVYSCPDGYDLSGDTTALCLYGNWTLDTDPSCTALSCNEEAPAGEMVVRNPSGSAPYQNGTEVVYSCPDGYALEGDMTAVCLYGNWTLDTEPSCEVLECANPAPMDPMVNLKPDLESYTNGTEVQYSCPNGFELNGDSSAVCVNGDWVFTEEPSCSVLSCDDVAPGDDVVERDPSGSGPFPNGTKVVYSCPDGYDLSGDTTALCLYGNWTLDTDPSCTALSCDEEAPAGEMVVRTPSGSAPYVNGTEVVYSCPDGYALEGDMTAVCRYGNWTLDTEPSCGASPCDEPLLEDPLVSHSPALAEGEMYPNGTEIYYACPSGWDFNGNMTAVCLYGGWTHEDGFCTASQCADQAPAGEMVLREPSSSGPFENGTQVAYSCPDGYDLAGDTTAVCQYGNWTLDAVPSCAASQCNEDAPAGDTVERDPVGSSPYPNGTEVVYSCSDGYTLVGDSSAVCQLGNWTLEVEPSCEASPCEDLAPAGELVERDPSDAGPFENGTEVDYSCPDGYDFNGDMTAICLYGNWTLDQEPYCTASPCGEPIIQDGLISHNPETSSYPSGTEVTYACPNGYDLNGNMTAVCLYGMWTNEAVFCTASPCEDLAPAGELVERDPSDAGPFENGTEVDYSCPDGYDFNGDMTAICLYGNWTLDQEPYCTASPCGEPIIQDGLISHNPETSSYPSGTEVTYACPNGYDLNGNMTAVCLYGMWTNEAVFCTASPCEDLAPAGELVERDPSDAGPFENGTEVDYSCPDGYDFNGDMTAICLYGNWTLDQEPYCSASPCGEPIIQDGLVSHNPETSSYPSGTEVTYACPNGYDLNGNMTAVCLYGMWTNEAVFCTASPCEDLAPAGELVERDPSDAGPFENGTEVDYSCPDGYDFNGDMTAICLYGNWTLDQEPYCTASPCGEPLPQDGLVSHNPEGSSYPSGTQVTYACPNGYDLNGNMTSVCLYGMWTNEAVFCTASPCEDLAPAGELVERDPSDAGPFENGTEVDYSCPDGYDFNGDMTAICLYGNWTLDQEPYCTASPCGEPLPQDGLVSHNPESSSYPNGTQVTYACPNGYDLNGNMTAVCLYGMWTNEAVFCTASPCEDLAPAGELVERDPSDAGPFENGTEVDYSCPDGYDFNGDMTAICLYGNWTLDQEPYCSASPCGEPIIQDGLVSHNPETSSYPSGTEVTYACPNGYDLNGNMTAVCLYGMWTNEAVFCTASPCEDLAPAGELVERDPSDAGPFENGTEVDYSCPDGYDFNGDMTAICLYGNWTLDQEPYCTASPCGEPLPQDGLVSHNPESSSYPSGTEVTYACPNGYDLNGNMTSVCLYGMWTNEAVFCTASPCEDLAPAGELVERDPSDAGPFENGTEVDYSCPDGYDFNGDMTAICLYGNWTLDQEPYCTASPCGEPLPQDGLVSHNPERSSYPNGTQVTYACPNGYDLNGNMTAVCLYGMWTNEAVFCTASPCEDLAPAGELVERDPSDAGPFENGTEVDYSCPDGYDFNGDMTAICLYGNWTLDQEPYCSASPCGEPIIQDGLVSHNPETSSYPSGTEVTYACPNGYDLNGNMTAVCLYGMWTNEAVFCTASPCEDLAPAGELVERDPSDAGPFENGTEVDYSCPDGYDFNGDMTAICLYGNWTLDQEPYCTASPCGEPLPQDGLVSHNPESSSYPSGTEVTYACPNGYDLNGNMTSVCLNGMWTNEAVFCTASPCEDLAPAGELVERDPSDAGPFENGTEVDYSCPDGYDFNGDMTAICLYGNWTLDQEPYCSASPCEDLAPAGELVERDPSDAGPFENGTEVDYSCPDGYDFNGDMTAICLYGNWTLDQEPYCTASPCGEPLPQDGLVSHNPEGSSYPSGTEVTYACPNGYDLNGNMTSVCLNGMWTNEAVFCTASPCEDLAPAGELVERDPSDAGPFENGTEVDYSCPDGYDFNGDMTALCLYGNWTLDQEPYCTASPCGEPLPQDGLVSHNPESSSYPSGTEVTYACPNGYDLNGNMTAVCLYGTWTNEAVFCTASPCQDLAPGDDVVGRTPGGSGPFPNGTEVVYSCPSGYDFNGDTTAVCQFGNWSLDTVPYCTASPCEDLAPAGELVERDPSDAGPFENGTEVDYSCPDGYDFNGDMTALCLYGNWTLDQEPYCSASACGEPVPQDGLVSHNPESSSYPSGTQVTYACPNGYDLNGNMTAVCLYGMWTNEAVFCTASPCDDLAPGDDLVVRDPSGPGPFANGTTVVYSCPKGYDFNGDMTAVCQFGNWSLDTEPYCTASPCVNPDPADVLVIVQPDRSEYGNGSTVMYSCPNGYDLIGDNSTVCLYGIWTQTTEPTCEASPCYNPNPADELVMVDPDQVSYENGTTVDYVCPSGYDLFGDSSALCRYGNWTSNEDPTCIESPCDNPNPSDENVSLDPDLTSYDHSSSVNFSCPVGYNLTVTASATCILGAWDPPEEPICEPLPCDPITPAAPDVTIAPVLSSYPSGTDLLYFCPSPSVVKGIVASECYLGEWDTTDTPTCVTCDLSTQCALDRTRVDRELQCVLASFGNTDDPCFGHWTSYKDCSCTDTTYRISSSGNTYWCNNNGKWDDAIYTVDCLAPCYTNVGSNVIAENSEGIEVEYIMDGDYVLYSCPDGFSAFGSPLVTCSDGLWENEDTFYCYADCTIPTNYELSDSSITDEVFQHNIVVSMKCVDGYTPTDINTYTCQDGSFDVPECELA